MRILYIPLDYHRHGEDDRFFGDMLRAFQKQSECIIYDGNIDRAIAFKPDAAFYQGSLSKEDCIKIKSATKCKWTMWTGDVRYAPVQSLIDFKEFTDVYYLPFSGELLNTYSKILSKKCRYIFEPIQDWKFIEPKELIGGVVSFVGNCYDNLPGGKERLDLMSFLSKHSTDTQFYGSLPAFINNRGQLNHYKVPELYNNSFAVIAENNMHDIEGYFTPRNLMAMAAGSCCLMKVFPGIEKEFKNWKDCIYYRHKYELLDIINFLKANPEVRNKIAVQGYEHAKRHYTMDNFVKQYIEQL